MTIADFLVEQANTNAGAWMTTWLNSNSVTVILRQNGSVFDAKSFNYPMTDDIDRIGWSGLSTDGTAQWIGWDLDVGHGKNCSETFGQALLSAVRLWSRLEGNAEIRVSTSGQGLHVRFLLPTQEQIHHAQYAASIASKDIPGIDPTPTGRQAFWFWDRNPQPGAFRQLLPSTTGVIDD